MSSTLTSVFGNVAISTLLLASPTVYPSASAIVVSVTSQIPSTTTLAILPLTTPRPTPSALSQTMMDRVSACYFTHEPSLATADPSIHSSKKIKKAKKEEANRIKKERSRCVFNKCMAGATSSCSITVTTATTTIHWDLLEPAQTPMALSQLEDLGASPRIRSPYLAPWHDRRILLNKNELADDQKRFGSFNWSDALAAEYTFPHEFANCSFQADSYIVEDGFYHINKPLGKNRLLAACNSAGSCERRCAALADFKDPSKMKMVLMVGGSTIGAICLLAGVLACCTCAKGKRRVPRSTLPRQPTVHDPEPAMSQATQSPRVVLTSPAPAPAPAQSPAPSQAFVRRVEDAAGQPPVVETTEETVGAPGAAEEVAEPVVRSVPAQVARAPTQVVSRAPTGAL